MSTPAEQDPLKPASTRSDTSAETPTSGEQQAGQADAGEAASSLAGDAMNLISEHKGKLAIGVAATLGLMVYYGWREKRLAKTDPEEYALLQKLRANMRKSDAPQKPRNGRKSAAGEDAEHAEPDAQQPREAGDSGAGSK
jgi:hypothetical protein